VVFRTCPGGCAGWHVAARARGSSGRPTHHEEDTMFKTVIVGVDGREGGRDALALAASLQRIFASDVIAVHAFPLDLYLGRGADGEYDDAIHERATKTVTDEVTRAGVTAHAVTVADGSPGRALQHAAIGHGGDLIVVGSAHHGRVGRVLAGDVTAGTLHGAPCAVLVAPHGHAEHGGELRTIGVGFDGSPESRAALELAHGIARAVGARLRVIDVVVPPDPGGPFPAYRPDWAENAHMRREEAEDRLAAVLAELGDIATGDLPSGDPARELAYAADELDLLVTGSRGYGPVRRLMLGSTSSRLVHEAPCPVLVLARGVPAPAEEAEAVSATAEAS
jgi:nucleotide-binding universal stress UspA family protein